MESFRHRLAERPYSFWHFGIIPLNVSKSQNPCPLRLFHFPWSEPPISHHLPCGPSPLEIKFAKCQKMKHGNAKTTGRVEKCQKDEARRPCAQRPHDPTGWVSWPR